MGYYTSFELGIEKGVEQDQDSLQKFLDDIKNEVTFGEYDLTIAELYSGDSDSMKWYGWVEDMQSLSKSYPNLLIWLTGRGEEAGDIWKAWFRNGKHVEVRPELDFPLPKDIDTKLPLIPKEELETVRLSAEIERDEAELVKKKKELDRRLGKQ